MAFSGRTEEDEEKSDRIAGIQQVFEQDTR
jgi:hypothetical protein